MIKVGIIGPDRARTEEFQKMFSAIAFAPQKCSECVAYYAEGNMSVPCGGDFPDHCEYNGTEKEEEEE
jgi:hypothetical protein